MVIEEDPITWVEGRWLLRGGVLSMKLKVIKLFESNVKSNAIINKNSSKKRWQYFCCVHAFLYKKQTDSLQLGYFIIFKQSQA